MRSIEEQFKLVQEKEPYLGDLICFMEAIKGRNYHEIDIRKKFRKLVSKEDYEKKDLPEIINWAISLSKNGSTKPSGKPKKADTEDLE